MHLTDPSRTSNGDGTQPTTNGRRVAHNEEPYSLQNLFGCRGTVVITGGNGCIGLAMVKGLAAAGADIVSIQIDEDNAVIKAAEAHGRRGAVYVADLSETQSTSEVFGKILADGWKPTTFIACAAIQRRGTFLEFERKWLEDLFTVNCTSQYVLAQDFARYRIAQAKLEPNLLQNTPFGRSNGKIIFLASNSSFQGGINISGYTATKAAILGMIRALSNELAPHNIQVNGVAPGYVQTTFTAAITADQTFYEQIAGRIPAGRWAQAEDMVASAIYLASAASNYTTGQAIIVDGGIVVK